MELSLLYKRWRTLCYCILLQLLVSISLYAQQAGKCDFKNNEFYVEVNKKATSSELQEFIKKFDLFELDLPTVVNNNKLDTLYKLGWKVISNTAQKLVITRPLFGSNNIQNPGSDVFYQFEPSFRMLFPVVSDEVEYGYNRFKNKQPFYIHDGTVRFYLRNHNKAQQVRLAGSFNNWSPDSLAMQKTDSGWIADVTLQPGKYWYKFIEDGNWMIDNDNQLKENDGLGNVNSVFFVPNQTFVLKGYDKARNVYVSGDFVDWEKKALKMQHEGDTWVLPLYLANGTHRFKYVVDGNWVLDPTQKQLPDGDGNTNSIIAFGPSTHFTLDGFTNAGKVVLSGDFNFWKPNELLMHKTATGWQLDYALAPGNYEYKFVVDGNWIIDPNNPLTVENEQGSKNSYMVVGANYTFHVKAFPNANKIFLAGDFNSWSASSLPMQKVGDEWIAKVHLSPGKHKYKLVVDGEWLTDPSNQLWEQNEYSTGNSVIWFDDVL